MIGGEIMAAVGFAVMLLARCRPRSGACLIKEAGEKGDKAQRDLAAHKVHAAETFATEQGMQEQTAQLLRAIESVGSRIDGISERLDRMFERNRGAGNS